MKKRKSKILPRVLPAPPNTAGIEAAKAESGRILSEAVGRAVDALIASGNLVVGINAKGVGPIDRRADLLLDAEQLAEVLALPNYRAVFKLVREHKIPVIRLFGHSCRYSLHSLRFSLPAVRSALEKLTVKEALPEPARALTYRYDFRRSAKTLELRVPNLKPPE